MVAGPKLIKPSKLISKNEALGLFPLMEIYELCGAVIFYDGIQDNTRNCLSKAMTAARHGAQVANHVEVIELVKRTAMDGTIIVSGVKVRVIDISTITVTIKFIFNFIITIYQQLGQHDTARMDY